MIAENATTALCKAGECAIGEISNAEVYSTVTILAGEFTKTIIVAAVFGAIVGVAAWELFKYTYNYAKQRNKQT